MRHAISLALVLYGLWLLNSGHYKPLLLALGVVSCLAAVAVALRMDVVDREGHPVHLTWRAPLYWAWLGGEIVKSAVDVSWRVLHPRLPVSPRVLRVRTSQPDDLGKVVYANSITLTPGTVSIDVGGGEIEVHALTREAADSLAAGEMDRRVTRMEGAA